MTERRHLLLWDGACGLCRGAVAWVEARDACRRFRAVPFQEAPSPPMTPALCRACRRAVHVITVDGRLLSAGRASLFILGELGWRRWARLLAMPPLVWATELAYWAVARHRRVFAPILFRRWQRRAARHDDAG